MSRAYVATSAVTASRIVYLDPSNQFAVIQAASATAHPLAGVAQPGTRYPPWVATDTAVAANATETLLVYTAGDKEVMCEAGAAISPGDWLTSNGSGQCITTTSTGNQVIGQAKGQAFALGDLIPIDIIPFVL